MQHHVGFAYADCAQLGGGVQCEEGEGKGKTANGKEEERPVSS